MCIWKCGLVSISVSSYHSKTWQEEATNNWEDKNDDAREIDSNDKTSKRKGGWSQKRRQSNNMSQWIWSIIKYLEFNFKFFLFK